MRLAWSRAELAAVCRSESALRTAWPAHADDLMTLLTMICSSATLGCLSRLRSVRLAVEPAAQPGRAPTLSMQYNEIQMRGTLVNAQGKPLIIHAVAEAPHWVDVDCIRIDAVAVAPESARRRRQAGS